MNFLKRAIFAVTRKKGKSIILFIIFAAIANLVLAGFAIKNSTVAASKDARKQLGGTITLQYDRQKAFDAARAAMTSGQGQGQQLKRIGRGGGFQGVPLTEAMVQMVANQKNIKGYNSIVTLRGGVADGFTPVVEPTPTPAPNAGATNQMDQGNFGRNQQQDPNYVQPNVGVTGVSATELSEAFNSGGATLLSGKHILPEDVGKKVAMIEKHLADQNSLKVGSKIKIKAAGSTNEVEYTIIGIYQAGLASSTLDVGFGFNSTASDPYNMIYTDYRSAIPLQTVTASDGTITEGGIGSAVFYLDDPNNFDAVKADIKAMKIDWDTYTIDADDSAYQAMVGPINNVASFAMLVVWLIGLAGAVIIGLILMLSIKERMYETGVLLSMGEAKVKIISQYVAEVLIIAILAFGLSAFTGKYISQGFSNWKLNNEVVASQTQNNAPTNGFGGGNRRNAMMNFFNQRGNSKVKPIDTMNVTISPMEVAQTSGVGLLIIIFGTILPAATVMRYKPKTILTKAT